MKSRSLRACVCVRVCAPMRMYACAYVRLCACMWVRMCVCVPVCGCACLYACGCACVRPGAYVVHSFECVRVQFHFRFFLSNKFEKVVMRLL